MASKKARCSCAGRRGDGGAERIRGEGAGGDDRRTPVGGRQRGHFFARDGDVGMAFQRLGDGGGKAMPVHRQGAAGRQLVGIGGSHESANRRGASLHAAGPPHCSPVVGAEGIGADQLGQAVGLVGEGAFYVAAFHAAPPPARPRPPARRLRNRPSRRRRCEVFSPCGLLVRGLTAAASP